MSTPMTMQPRYNPRPPEKGSFPLDHDGECRSYMVKYMLCLKNNNRSISKCRDESKRYLECRMSKNLMTREPWQKLGFSEETQSR